MARIRTVKPEFFEDENLAKLSPHARLLFIGLFQLADKNGVLENRPAWIQSKVFPYESGEASDVSRLLPGLVLGRYLVEYEVNGRAYLAVRNFSKHQRITGKEAKSNGLHPLPPSGDAPGKHRGNTGEAPGATPDAQEQGTGNREQGTGNRENSDAPEAAPPIDPEARWPYERALPWAIQIQALGGKIGSGNWMAWKRLSELHPASTLARAAESVRADQRWPDQVEMAIKQMPPPVRKVERRPEPTPEERERRRQAVAELAKRTGLAPVGAA
jgi:hypothetical protein